MDAKDDIHVDANGNLNIALPTVLSVMEILTPLLCDSCIARLLGSIQDLKEVNLTAWLESHLSQKH